MFLGTIPSDAALIDGVFRYRWEKNGKPFNWQVYSNRMLEQPGRGTLVITSPRTEDIGEIFL